MGDTGDGSTPTNEWQLYTVLHYAFIVLIYLFDSFSYLNVEM